ncbi:MAG: hypothetical protein HRU22_07480 [Gammaproteobacteria bacterium]|nr:hypothetical protein [Gammaproteobacteria bacterium]
MKHLKKFHKAPFRVLKLNKKRVKIRFRWSMIKLKAALAQEKQETKEMLQIYAKFTQGGASKVEINIANKQFLDILKGLGLGVFALLPFAPITIPLLVKLAKLVGVELLPSSFSQNNKNNKD